MKWQHIYPVKDLKPHRTDWPKVEELCECMPKIDWDDKLVIHNAYDLREAVEEAEAILEDADAVEIMRTNEAAEDARFCDCGQFGRCTKFCICFCHREGKKK